MTELAKWFPVIDQMSPSMKGLCSVAFATIVALSVVVFIVFRGHKGGSNAK